MIKQLARKFRTLVDTLDDYSAEPLASFAALDKGLEDRHRPAPPELLDRLIAAYRAAKRDQASVGPCYHPNGEWYPLIEQKLALLVQDGSVLMNSVENFFRSGLGHDFIDGTYGTLRHTKTRLQFINAVLHDFRVWRNLTDEPLDVLDIPPAGNPFGLVIDDHLIIPTSFRHHYMARKAANLIDDEGIIAEIGGGYGGLAYFALASPWIRYVDFELPEVLLCASYWLCSVLPDRKIALYGEGNPDEVLANLDRYDAVLYPNFCLPKLADRSVDLFVNTRSLSEMSRDTVDEYLGQINRTSKTAFLHENSDIPLVQKGHKEVAASSFPLGDFRLLSKTPSPWRAGVGRYFEYLCERRPTPAAQHPRLPRDGRPVGEPSVTA